MILFIEQDTRLVYLGEQARILDIVHVAMVGYSPIKVTG